MTEKTWQQRIQMREIFRYMGMKGQTGHEQMQPVAEQQLERLLRTAQVRTYYQIFPLVHEADAAQPGTMKLGPMEVRSQALARNLQGCTYVAMFGVTLGLDVDRLIYRLGRTVVSEAVVTDACAAAVIEAICDELCETLRGEAARLGCKTRPRFSPGFVDFTLEEYQQKVIQTLELSKRIGIHLTEGGMMTPAKSVTAVVGFYPAPS